MISKAMILHLAHSDVLGSLDGLLEPFSLDGAQDLKILL
jgi:hypothetical protein